jgi:hypothetical protein
MGYEAICFVLTLCVLSASAAFAQTKTPLEGVWKITEIVWKDGKRTPQSSLLIYTKSYYSEVYVTGGKPREAVPLPKDRDNPTDAEKLALYSLPLRDL